MTSPIENAQPEVRGKKIPVFAPILFAIVAAMPARAVDDDCVELQQLRAFRERNNYVSIVGQIVHRCPQALGVHLKVTFRDANGLVVDVEQGWPASVSDIEPNKAFPFKLSYQIDREWATFNVEVIEKRTWKRK
jgi:hypothetical protein